MYFWLDDYKNQYNKYRYYLSYFFALHQFTLLKQFSIAQSEKTDSCRAFHRDKLATFDRQHLRLQNTYLYTSHRTSLLIASEKKWKIRICKGRERFMHDRSCADDGSGMPLPLRPIWMLREISSWRKKQGIEGWENCAFISEDDVRAISPLNFIDDADARPPEAALRS